MQKCVQVIEISILTKTTPHINNVIKILNQNLQSPFMLNFTHHVANWHKKGLFTLLKETFFKSLEKLIKKDKNVMSQAI